MTKVFDSFKILRERLKIKVFGFGGAVRVYSKQQNLAEKITCPACLPSRKDIIGWLKTSNKSSYNLNEAAHTIIKLMEEPSKMTCDRIRKFHSRARGMLSPQRVFGSKYLIVVRNDVKEKYYFATGSEGRRSGDTDDLEEQTYDAARLDPALNS